MMPTFSRAAIVGLAIAGIVGCASSNARPGPPRRTGVTSSDIEHNAGRPIEEVLQAKEPGLWVRRTADGGVSVQVRGTSSFMGDNEPLYVIDDVPMHAGPGGALSGINPYDIDTIHVLKDPAETAIYGIRGSNGVIVIRTKRGKP